MTRYPFSFLSLLFLLFGVSRAYAAPGFMDFQNFLLEVAGLCLLLVYIFGLITLVRWNRERSRPRAPSFKGSAKSFFKLLFLISLLAGGGLYLLTGSVLALFGSGILLAILVNSLAIAGVFHGLRWLGQTSLLPPRLRAAVYPLALIGWLAIPVWLLGSAYLSYRDFERKEAGLMAALQADKSACEEGKAERCVAAFEGYRELSRLPGHYEDHERAAPYLEKACLKGMAHACKDFVFHTGLSGGKAKRFFSLGCQSKDGEACVYMADRLTNSRKARAIYREQCSAGIALACQRMKE